MARIIICVFLYLSAAYQVCADGLSQPLKTGKPAATSEQARRSVQERIIISKLAYYARNFPKIDFVLLDSSGNTERNMGIMLTILGHEPDPLDYSHPESLRQPLLEVTYTRIMFLLQHAIGSATLFSPGEGAHAKRRQVCIITMNPWKIAQDNKAATRHLLEIPGKFLTDIAPARYLDANTHLRFVLDHEIFHCLDTSINGPVPMSRRQHWGGYYMRRNETGADAFGVLMHLAEAGHMTSYARNLGLIRGLTLLNGDPNHYTYPVFEHVLHLDLSRLAGSNVQDIFRLATRLRTKVVGSYRDYLLYAAAAQVAMTHLGVGYGSENFTDITADPATVDKLIRQVNTNYRKLMGHKLRSVE